MLRTTLDFAPPAHLAQHAHLRFSHKVTLKRLSHVAKVRQDDVVFVLDKLGMLASNRRVTDATLPRANGNRVEHGLKELGEWHGLELVISLDTILRGCEKWKVRGKGILDERACRT